MSSWKSSKFQLKWMGQLSNVSVGKISVPIALLIVNKPSITHSSNVPVESNFLLSLLLSAVSLSLAQN